METKKFMFVEDGSVDVDDLKKEIEEKNLPIMVVVYRQGAKEPKLVDINTIKEM